jgi:hypothetical protein
MKWPRLILVLLIMGLLAPQAPVVYADLSDILKGFGQIFKGRGLSESRIIEGLKEALQIGTAKAVEKVSLTDGYFKNPRIHIPLPEEVQKIEKLVRTMGLGAQVDAFELSMNRAAERAAPEAKSLFVDAIKQMTFSDARTILQGRQNEATLYFEDKTRDRLYELFKPLVHNAMSKVGVTRSYQKLDTTVRTIPFADKLSFDLDDYVTNKGLDGLFLMVAEEERKIREDPAARVTDLLKEVFGRASR